MSDEMPKEGHVVSGWQGQSCKNSDCGVEFDESGAYLHTNRETGKLLLLCEKCSMQAQMYDALRLPLVAL